MDGVDTVISTVLGASTGQTNLIYAAKAANVKRFVPSEFAWEVPRGVITMLDGVCFSSTTLHDSEKNDLETGRSRTHQETRTWIYLHSNRMVDSCSGSIFAQVGAQSL